MASRRPLIQSAWCMPTNRTHQANASLRLLATPPATRVSRMARSGIRSRVITGTLRAVKTLVWSPHFAPQATLRRNWRSASRAMRTRSSLVSSRKRSMRAERAAARPSSEVPAASSTSGSGPITRISSPSLATSGGPANQPAGTLLTNQAEMSSAIDYKITCPGPGQGRLRGGFVRSGAHELELVHDHLGPPALLAGGVLPRARVKVALRKDRSTLVEVLAGKLGELAENDQVVKLRLLFCVAGVVFARIRVGGQPELGDVRALGRRLDLRVCRDIPDQDHLVDHRSTSVNLCQRSFGSGIRLPSLLRRQPRDRVDRRAVDLDLEMHMGTGRQARRTDLTDHAVGHDGLAGLDPELGEVAVEDARVSIDHDDHVIAGSIRVETDVGGAGRRRVDFRSTRCRKVDARVYVASGTKRIERLELQRRAAELLADRGAHYNGGDRQPLVAGDLGGNDDPNHCCPRNDCKAAKKRNQAVARACS